MIYYKDYEPAVLEDYLKALHAEKQKRAAVLSDWEQVKFYDSAIEWITQACILNLRIDRLDVQRAYDYWLKEKPPETPKEK